MKALCKLPIVNNAHYPIETATVEGVLPNKGEIANTSSMSLAVLPH